MVWPVLWADLSLCDLYLRRSVPQCGLHHGVTLCVLPCPGGDLFHVTDLSMVSPVSPCWCSMFHGVTCPVPQCNLLHDLSCPEYIFSIVWSDFTCSLSRGMTSSAIWPLIDLCWCRTERLRQVSSQLKLPVMGHRHKLLGNQAYRAKQVIAARQLESTCTGVCVSNALIRHTPTHTASALTAYVSQRGLCCWLWTCALTLTRGWSSTMQALCLVL